MKHNASPAPISGADGMRGTLLFVERNLKLWDQNVWGADVTADDRECGTVHCFAGWGLALAGAQFRPLGEKGHDYEYVALASLPFFVQNALTMEGYCDADSEYAATEDAARELFELADTEADTLFCSGNTLGDLRRLVRQYALDPGQTFSIPWHSVRLTFSFGDPAVEALCDEDGHAEDECMAAALVEDDEAWRHDMPATAGMHKLKIDVDRYGETYTWGPMDVEDSA